MKIEQIELQNVKSFRNKETINLKKGVNIFIGPNAGGKSNLMDIINITLGYFFIYPWRLIQNTASSGLTVYNLQNKRDLFNPIQQFLDKNLEIENQEQIIKINFQVTDEDLKNIKTIIDNKDKLIEFEEKRYKSKNIENFSLLNGSLKKYKNSIVKYEIKNYSQLNNTKQNNFSKFFLNYLNYFELFVILVEEYNSQKPDKDKIKKLYPLNLYFSPYRNPAI